MQVSITVRPTILFRTLKSSAITTIANLFNESLVFAAPREWTLVPIPPSKNKSSPYYDDRMVQCLKLYCEQQSCDFKELITTGADMVASHSTSNRYSVAEIEANLHLDESLSQNLQPNIALVDDVLTTGAHYKAAERMIKRYF